MYSHRPDVMRGEILSGISNMSFQHASLQAVAASFQAEAASLQAAGSARNFLFRDELKF